MNSGQETSSLKALLRVQVERAISLAKSRYDVAVFESISLSGLPGRDGYQEYWGEQRGEQAAASRITETVLDHFLNTVPILAFIRLKEKTIQANYFLLL